MTNTTIAAFHPTRLLPISYFSLCKILIVNLETIDNECFIKNNSMCISSWLQQQCMKITNLMTTNFENIFGYSCQPVLFCCRTQKRIINMHHTMDAYTLHRHISAFTTQWQQTSSSTIISRCSATDRGEESWKRAELHVFSSSCHL